MTTELLVGTVGGPRARDLAVLELVNDIRRDHGLHPLRRGDRATRAARMRAQHMARTGEWTHEGSLPWTEALERVGLGDRAAGENIAKGFRDPADVVRGWMNSPGHRRNILDPKWRVMGLAADIDDGGDTVWSQILTAGP